MVFLTPDGGAIADECHEQLSITYAPGYRYTLDFNNQLFKNASIFDMKDNRGQQINNAEAIQSAPRVWPAFGLTGGRREIIGVLKDKCDPVNFKDELVLTDGGAPTLWYQDDVVGDFVKNLADGLCRAAVSVPGIDIDRNNTLILNKGNGLSLSFKFRDLMGSLSSAYVGTKMKVEECNGSGNDIKIILTVRFWLAIWHDDTKIGERRLLDNFIEPITQSCRCINGFFPCAPDIIATNAANALLERMILISDAFFNSHCRKVSIPPSS